MACGPSAILQVWLVEARKVELDLELKTTKDEAPALLHPGLANRYRGQVANLTNALTDPSSMAEATSIIRSLLSEIRMIPECGILTIELVGELAGLLSLGIPKSKQSHPKVACSTVMVAGVGFEPTTFRL